MKKILLSALLPVVLICELFAQGYYIEMKITSDQQGFSGNMKLYFQDGNSRSDISMTVPMMGAMNFSTITQAKTPGVAYMLDEKNKTYSEIKTDSDEEWKDYPQSDYEVTVIGKETVNGYSATHVNVKRKGSKTSEDYWNTKDIAEYAGFSKIKSKYTGKENLDKALEAKGAAGFPVRIKTVEQGTAIQIDVVKAEKKTNPASLCSLEGYKKSESASILPAGIDLNEIMKNAQNMTPEQLEQLQKQMEQQYKPH